MKKLVLLAGLGAMALCRGAHAQDVLSSYTQAATATANTTSYDYRYTRHSVSTGGRGSRPHIYYSWDPHVDEATTMSLPVALNLSQPVTDTSSGTFYGSGYSASAAASASLTNTPTSAVLSVNYGGATTVAVKLGAHQGVTVTAQPSGTFTFTITRESDVRVTTNGDPGGFFRLFAPGAGVILGPLYGTNSTISLDTPLAPGTYWVTHGLTYTSGLNTQANTVTNPGTTSTAWGFTMTITPTGDSGGLGGLSSPSGSDN